MRRNVDAHSAVHKEILLHAIHPDNLSNPPPE
jgi:hypothetical protein